MNLTKDLTRELNETLKLNGLPEIKIPRNPLLNKIKAEAAGAEKVRKKRKKTATKSRTKSKSRKKPPQTIKGDDIGLKIYTPK